MPRCSPHPTPSPDHFFNTLPATVLFRFVERYDIDRAILNIGSGIEASVSGLAGTIERVTRKSAHRL